MTTTLPTAAQTQTQRIAALRHEIRVERARSRFDEDQLHLAALLDELETLNTSLTPDLDRLPNVCQAQEIAGREFGRPAKLIGFRANGTPIFQ